MCFYKVNLFILYSCIFLGADQSDVGVVWLLLDAPGLVTLTMMVVTRGSPVTREVMQAGGGGGAAA